MKLPVRSPWVVLTALVSFVVAMWAVFDRNTPRADRSSPDAVAMAGQWGDKFGAINTLFTGLAFAGLIATLWHERKNAEDREAEQRELIAAMKRQADAATLAATVAAIRAILMSLDADSSRYGADTVGGMQNDEARLRLRRRLHDIANTEGGLL